MFKKALLKCGYIIKQTALKTRSTRAEESRNTQDMLINNIPKSIKNYFKNSKMLKAQSSSESLKLG